MDLKYFGDQLDIVIFQYGPKVLLAIIFLVVGLAVIKTLTRLFNNVMKKKDVDVSLRNFLYSLSGILLKILLILSVIQMVGIETTSFVAVLAAAGFAIGMALQGSLGNFAGGVLILFFKPFKVGDFIEAQGFSGTVNSIQVFNTVLKTPDNRTVIIPNGALSSGPITNVNAEQQRRVDMTFGIGYGDDIIKARNVIKKVIDEDDRILKDPEPMIVVSDLADSSVNFAVRVWCDKSNYWGIYFDTHEKIKLEFDKEKISIPFPQRDVHIFNQ